MRRPHNLLLVLTAAMLLAAGRWAYAAEAAQLTLAVQNQPDGTVLLTARVTDAKGVPVKGTAVTFRVKTTFGWLVVGEIPIDATGRARTVLSQVPRFGQVTAEAEAGEKTLTAAQALTPLSVPPPHIRPGTETLRELSPQPGLISPRPVPLEVVFLVIVLGGVWSTYTYVVSTLLRMGRVPATRSRL